MQFKLHKKIPLSRFTTYRTGGAAEYLTEAKSAEEMIHMKEFARLQNMPYIVIGGGSNTLFSDKGFPGLVIINRMTKMHIQGDVVTAESGVLLSKMVMIAAQHNLGGISGLAVIPGTVGGAVYGNAGIPDIYISDVLSHAIILRPKDKKPVIVHPDYFKFSYRDSEIKKTKDIILSASFKLKPEPIIKIKAEINNYLNERSKKQPTGKTCGSFFKNPGHFPSAGWLIEQAGCKGMKVGGAEVSPVHANFIMNTGSATSDDIINLTVRVHKKVKNKFDVDLFPEVQILPESPFNTSS